MNWTFFVIGGMLGASLELMFSLGEWCANKSAKERRKYSLIAASALVAVNCLVIGWLLR